MQRRILLALTAFLLSVPNFAHAQFTTKDSSFEATSADSLRPETLQSKLEAGYSLERQKRWADALVHYEETSLEFPNSLDIKQRLQIVRT